MKVTSSALFEELRSALAPPMREAGFDTVREARLGWTRPTPKGRLTVWFQCDAHGWDDAWGSKFTVEFELGSAPGGGTDSSGHRLERIGYLLEGFDELDELRVRNNRVIERLPGTLDGRLVVARLDDGTEFVAEGERVEDRKAVYGLDLWLNYHSLADAREWASYFARNLLRFVSIFEDEIKSEQGQARVRFNQLMSRVQGTKDAGAKARLFEDYIEAERDSEFRAAAVKWLRHLREATGGGPTAPGALGGSGPTSSTRDKTPSASSRK